MVKCPPLDTEVVSSPPGMVFKIFFLLFLIFNDKSSFACFLNKLPLILMVGQKKKKCARDICKGTFNIEFEQD